MAACLPASCRLRQIVLDQPQQQRSNTAALMVHFVAQHWREIMTPSNTVLSVHIKAKVHGSQVGKAMGKAFCD